MTDYTVCDLQYIKSLKLQEVTEIQVDSFLIYEAISYLQDQQMNDIKVFFQGL